MTFPGFYNVEGRLANYYSEILLPKSLSGGINDEVTGYTNSYMFSTRDEVRRHGDKQQLNYVKYVYAQSILEEETARDHRMIERERRRFRLQVFLRT